VFQQRPKEGDWNVLKRKVRGQEKRDWSFKKCKHQKEKTGFARRTILVKRVTSGIPGEAGGGRGNGKKETAGKGGGGAAINGHAKRG